MTTNLNELIPHIKAAQVDIDIHVSAQLNITPFVARQKVNRLLATEVSTGLGSGTPELVVTEQRLCWRVPVHLALAGRGQVGQVGQIDVDVQSGQLLVSQTELQAIVTHAERLFAGTPSAAA